MQEAHIYSRKEGGGGGEDVRQPSITESRVGEEGESAGDPLDSRKWGGWGEGGKCRRPTVVESILGKEGENFWLPANKACNNSKLGQTWPASKG